MLQKSPHRLLQRKTHLPAELSSTGRNRSATSPCSLVRFVGFVKVKHMHFSSGVNPSHSAVSSAHWQDILSQLASPFLCEGKSFMTSKKVTFCAFFALLFELPLQMIGEHFQEKILTECFPTFLIAFLSFCLNETSSVCLRPTCLQGIFQFI